MEHLGANSEGWNSMNGIMSSEESDFMEQFLGSLSDEVPNCSNLLVSLSFWPYDHESDDNTTNINSHNNVYALSKGRDNYYSYNNTRHEMSTADYYKTTMEDADAMEAVEFLNNDVVSNDNTSTDTDSNKNTVTIQLRSIEIEKTPMQETLKEDKSKKRSRNISGEVQQNTRNIKLIKRAASKSDDNDYNTKQRKNDSSSSMYCSEEIISSDSHRAAYNNVVSASSSPKDSAGLTTLNLNAGKVRANRGSATDPQSLYARKRRERINERLRVLQNLVPNGTKVDISTMLEEAVQYVKFLQLQIKLLSSDDLWMYAPLAYNGMEIGLA